MLLNTGKPAEAEAEFRKAVAIRQKLVADDPPVTEFRRGLVSSQNTLAKLLSNTGKPAEAEAEFHKALALWKKLIDDNPAVTALRSGLADSHLLSRRPVLNTGKLGGEGVPQGDRASTRSGREAAVTQFRSDMAWITTHSPCCC